MSYFRSAVNKSRGGRDKQLDVSIGDGYAYIDHKDVNAPNDRDYNLFLELGESELHYLYIALKDYFEA